jgi:hypothetical protein
MNNAGLVPDAFIVLQVPDEACLIRSTLRRWDPETNTAYHMQVSSMHAVCFLVANEPAVCSHYPIVLLQ